MKNEVNKLSGEAELLNKTSDAIYVCSMYNVITVWNRGAEKMFGWLEVIALNCHKRAVLSCFPRENTGTVQPGSAPEPVCHLP